MVRRSGAVIYAGARDGCNKILIDCTITTSIEICGVVKRRCCDYPAFVQLLEERISVTFCVKSNIKTFLSHIRSQLLAYRQRIERSVQRCCKRRG
jgi:hypothetical protein